MRLRSTANTVKIAQEEAADGHGELLMSLSLEAALAAAALPD